MHPAPLDPLVHRRHRPRHHCTSVDWYFWIFQPKMMEMGQILPSKRWDVIISCWSISVRDIFLCSECSRNCFTMPISFKPFAYFSISSYLYFRYISIVKSGPLALPSVLRSTYSPLVQYSSQSFCTHVSDLAQHLSCKPIQNLIITISHHVVHDCNFSNFLD